EREQAREVVVEIERAPAEQAAIGTFARAGCRTIKRKASFAKARRELVEVARMRGPTYESGFRELRKAASIGHSGLLWVWSDDFEIVVFAERKKGVARAAARMNAAENGAHSRVLLDKSDAVVEIAAAEKHVVERGRHFTGS